MFLISFLVTAFVLSKSYSGAVISFLSVPLYQKPINTMAEIVEVKLVLLAYQAECKQMHRYW